jgi:hypothetical protein
LNTEKKISSEEGFKQLLVDAKKLVEDADNYEHEDKTVQDPEYSFKISFYFSVLGTTVTSISESFAQLKCRMTLSVFCVMHVDYREKTVI